MNQLRVLLFTDAEVFAGTERHVLDLALGLREAGAVPTIACTPGAMLAERAEELGFPTLAIANGGLMDRAAVRTLCRQLKAGKFDLIHTHNGRTHLVAVLAILLARRGRCVFTQHFIEPSHTQQSGLKGRLFAKVHHWVNHRTDQTIAISDAVYQGILARHEAPTERVRIIWNGVSDPLLQPAIKATTGQQIRERFSIPTAAPLVLCAARLEAEKDVASLVAAFGIVSAAQPTAHCLIAGEGSLRGELQHQIEQLKLADKVQLLGFIPDVLALMRGADIFVLPSPNEPFGLVLAEAMAVEKPVVSINQGGAAEIVVPGETGLLTPPSAPEALAAALLSLLENPAQAEKFGRAGRERFQALFSVPHMAKATLAVYQAALGVEPTSPA